MKDMTLEEIYEYQKAHIDLPEPPPIGDIQARLKKLEELIQTIIKPKN